MDSNKAIQVSNEIESALSEILPDLYQMLQRYQALGTLEIVLCNLEGPDTPKGPGIPGCIRCNGRYLCGDPTPKCLLDTDADTLSGLIFDPEKEKQFCTELELKLSVIFPRLRQLAVQVDKSFEINLLIHPVTIDRNYVSCKFVDGVFVCSDQLQ